MTIENTNELNDLGNHIINVINQLIKWKNRGVNSLLEHNVIIKIKYNNIESFSLNEDAEALDLIEIHPSCTPDKPILNTPTDTNEVENNTSLEDPPKISAIGNPTCSNLS